MPGGDRQSYADVEHVLTTIAAQVDGTPCCTYVGPDGAGDAPGDRDAAKSTGVLYYPINPGREEQSWKRFHDEALDHFLTGSYKGEYEAALIAEFEALLPDTPPWKR